MALYSAGAVGVDIRPDTDNFWKILNAELHSRHPEVTVDVNTKGVARAKEQMRDLDGKTLTNVVKIDGDPSGLRAIDKAMQAQRKRPPSAAASSAHSPEHFPSAPCGTE